MARKGIDQALREVGLVILTGHGLPSALQQSALSAADSLFALPAATKASVKIDHEKRFGRGYIGFGDESGLATYFEPKEGYSYGQPRAFERGVEGTGGTGGTGGMGVGSVGVNGSHGGSETAGSTSNLLSTPNTWPSPAQFPDSHVDSLHSLYDAKVQIAKIVVGALAAQFECANTSTTSVESAESAASASTLSGGGRSGSGSGISSSGSSGQVPSEASLFDLIAGGEDISLMRMFRYHHLQSETVRSHMGLGLGQGQGQKQGQTQEQTQEQIEEQEQAQAQEDKRPKHKPVLGSSPHTDWGMLTVISADDVRGLQFLPKRSSEQAQGQGTEPGEQGQEQEQWVDVPHIPGAVVVNAGDYLQLVTRGLYHSPVHRVLVPGSAGMRTSGADSSSGSGSSSSSGSSGSSVTDTPNLANVAIGTTGESHTTGNIQTPSRTSFVFFFYPGYEFPVRSSVFDHCTHTSAPAPAETPTKAGTSVHTYNTLLQLEEGAAGAPVERTFGDYIVQKWMGVYRG
ncbi:hypothetical protein B484DRAFT_452019 [Ochromonadaceae sp. CCMP2298]|nr:hypothetical protein B484DRAFT_452019 [Ochromonadaceae sp. CCMP2298]